MTEASPSSEHRFLTETRSSYDTIAEYYAEHLRDELATRPVDRATLATFAELVHETGNPRIADIGCGPGRLTGHLLDLGLDPSGVDLSPGMIAQARQAHPGARFDVGSMLDLDLPDGELGGVVAWYSIIHVPTELLPEVFAGFHRILAPGGYLQLAFQTGDELVRRTEAAGFPLTLDFHRRHPDDIAALLAAARFDVRIRTIRQPDPDRPFPETTPQAYLLARKPNPATPGPTDEP